MISRCVVGKGITGAVRYALGEGRGAGNDNLAPGEQSRVAWIGGTGFGFAIRTAEDADLARRVMEFDALNQSSPTRRCEKDAVHLALSWRPGETPSREEMEAAACSALAAMGMANAKAIFASHNDEAYAHVHIVASKINPDTGRAYDLKGNYLKLSQWAHAWERDHGGVVCLQREGANALRAAIDARDAGAVLAAMTEQRATFTAAELERSLARQIEGQFARAQFAEKVLTHGEAVKLADEAQGRTTRYTSRTVLEAEGQVLRAAGGLARADHHGLTLAERQAILSRPEFASITREQATAFRHATEAGGLALIDGQAGTGKSYTIAAIRQVYAAHGAHVIGLAPTNAIAEDMRAGGFERAATIHSELFRLKNGRTSWNARTVLILDEAAMIDTKLMAQVTGHAYEAGAKLIMVGDDRQLSSIDRGGMFGVLKDRHGAAELSEVRRQHKNDERRAAEHMAEGNFHTALAMYDQKGAIHWTRTQDEARAALVEQWAKDSAAAPDKSRFVFAYTNAEVDRLNADIRAVRKQRGELAGQDHRFQTRHGLADFAGGDRIQITGTDKSLGLINGAAGTIETIDGDKIAVRLDGRAGKLVAFDAQAFAEFRHGYAGTIYKGQGRTLDQTYLYHSEQWRSAASYVALTRHRDKTELFVATNTAPDVKQLARQMARVENRRAASHYHQLGAPEPVRPLTPQQLPQIEVPVQQQTPPPAHTLDWTDRGGMVAQQQSALRASRSAAVMRHRAQAEPPAAPTSQPVPKREAPTQPTSTPDSAAPKPDIGYSFMLATNANITTRFAAPTQQPQPTKMPTPVSPTQQAPAPPINRPLTANEILSRHSDPAMRARYDHEQRQRNETQKPAAPPEPQMPPPGRPEAKRSLSVSEFADMLARKISEDERTHDPEKDRGHALTRGGRGRTR